MADTIDKYSDAMLARYFGIYFAAWDVFRANVNALERRKLESGVTMQERNDIEVKLLWLHGEHAKMMQRRTAFLQGAASVVKPTKEQEDTVKKLSADADKFVNSTKNLTKLTALADQASQIISAIHA